MGIVKTIVNIASAAAYAAEEGAFYRKMFKLEEEINGYVEDENRVLEEQNKLLRQHLTAQRRISKRFKDAL